MAMSENIYFPSIRVKGFKAIDDLSIGALARVNLIAGDNNVGKSTLLEALYVFAMGGNMDVMAQLACKRMGFPLEVDMRDEKMRQLLLLSFFKDWRFELGKLISFQTEGGKALKLQAVCAYNRKVEEKEGRYYLAESYVNDEEGLAEAVENVRRGVYRTNGSMDGFYPLDGRFSYFELEEQQANVILFTHFLF